MGAKSEATLGVHWYAGRDVPKRPLRTEFPIERFFSSGDRSVPDGPRGTGPGPCRRSESTLPGACRARRYTTLAKGATRQRRKRERGPVTAGCATRDEAPDLRGVRPTHRVRQGRTADRDLGHGVRGCRGGLREDGKPSSRRASTSPLTIWRRRGLDGCPRPLRAASSRWCNCDPTTPGPRARATTTRVRPRRHPCRRDPPLSAGSTRSRTAGQRGLRRDGDRPPARTDDPATRREPGSPR